MAESQVFSESHASHVTARIVNVAAYLFVSLNNLPQRQRELRTLCRDLQLKGTILLSPEGINLFVAGERVRVDSLLDSLRSDPALAPLEVKESFSNDQPFERMLVKIKREIIAFGQDGIEPARQTSRKISAVELKDWMNSGRDLVLLDVRNNFEVRVGTFQAAVPVDVDNFRDFPDAIQQLPEDLRRRPVVMFCTGGIRCEKAGPYMEQAGFQEIYQLDGGILKYFEEVGGEHYRGECFVFDKRVALGPDLKPTATQQCYACLEPLSVEDQQSPLYDPPRTCPHCYQTPEEKQAKLIAQRQAALRRVTTPLPGSVPYDNPRPLNVRQKFAGLTLLEFVRQNHPHLGDEYWAEVCRSGRIHQGGQPVPPDRIVRPGEQFAHFSIASIEPDVNPKIEILHEDDALVVVNKPAPLPCHPCGRFNRNSLQWILNEVYAPLKLRPPHRLDANTTGVVIFCKTRANTQLIHAQFETNTVEKTYLVRVQGCVPWKEHLCEAPVSVEPGACGGRTICEAGLPSTTRFERLHVFEDETTLLKAVPVTGRTNQIRVHLWHLGFPVQGDPLYLTGQNMGQTQTMTAGEVMCLHASQLVLQHPLTRAEVTYAAPNPVWAQIPGLRR